MSIFKRPPAPIFGDIGQAHYLMGAPDTIISDSYRLVNGTYHWPYRLQWGWGVDSTADNNIEYGYYANRTFAMSLDSDNPVVYPGHRYYSRYRVQYDSASGPWTDWSPIASVLLNAGAYVKYQGVWKRAVPYVKVNGVWKMKLPQVRYRGFWETTWS